MDSHPCKPTVKEKSRQPFLHLETILFIGEEKKHGISIKLEISFIY
uniref:Uncharacterized protein n=1 Tax=Rhizophora mucronata TaxID=61149 RepID=A0A2P2NGD9_RHIMU